VKNALNTKIKNSSLFFQKTFAVFSKNLRWFFKNSSLVFQKLFAENSKTLRWFFKNSSLVFKNWRRLFKFLA